MQILSEPLRPGTGLRHVCGDHAVHVVERFPVAWIAHPPGWFRCQCRQRVEKPRQTGEPFAVVKLHGRSRRDLWEQRVTGKQQFLAVVDHDEVAGRVAWRGHRGETAWQRFRPGRAPQRLEGWIAQCRRPAAVPGLSPRRARPHLVRPLPALFESSLHFRDYQLRGAARGNELLQVVDVPVRVAERLRDVRLAGEHRYPPLLPPLAETGVVEVPMRRDYD